MNIIDKNFIYCTVTIEDSVFDIKYYRSFQSTFESISFMSELIQQGFKFKHEKICVRLDKNINSNLNFLVKKGPQNYTVTHQSYVSVDERFITSI